MSTGAPSHHQTAVMVIAASANSTPGSLMPALRPANRPLRPAFVEKIDQGHSTRREMTPLQWLATARKWLTTRRQRAATWSNAAPADPSTGCGVFFRRSVLACAIPADLIGVAAAGCDECVHACLQR